MYTVYCHNTVHVLSAYIVDLQTFFPIYVRTIVTYQCIITGKVNMFLQCVSESPFYLHVQNGNGKNREVLKSIHVK